MENIQKILENIRKLKEIEEEAKLKRKKLEQELFSQVDKPEDGKPLWLADDTKIVWRAEAKINQKRARLWLEKNPELSKRIFSITVKPKISEISKLERTMSLEETPPWLKDFESLKQEIIIEEKPTLQFLKEGKESEEDE